MGTSKVKYLCILLFVSAVYPQIAVCAVVDGSTERPSGHGANKSQLTESQVAVLRAATAVRLVVEERYVDHNRDPIQGYSYPFSRRLSEVLKYAGMAVRPSFERNSVCTIRVVVVGRSKRHFEYVRATGSKAWRFTQADVSGSITFEFPGLAAHTRPFRGSVRKKSEPHYITRFLPKEAPFHDALLAPGSFFPVILTMIADARGPDWLVQALVGWDHTQTVHAIAEAIEHCGRKAVPPLLQALSREDEYGREGRAAQLLGRIGDRSAFEALQTAARNSKNKFVRHDAIEALGALGDARAVECLVHILQDTAEDWGLRIFAARALGDIGDQRAVDPLITSIEDKNTGDRL